MPRRASRPLILAQPTRFGGVEARTARVVLTALVVLLLIGLTALGAAPLAGDAPTNGQTDIALYSGVVEALRHGGHYYPALADQLRAGGYPLRPFIAFRLPTLAVVQAALPHWLLLGALWGLALAVIASWYPRLRVAVANPLARGGAMLVLLAGMFVVVQPSLAWFHESWAGLLIAWSLGRHAQGRWAEAAALGLAAALIRETAALYLLVMAAWAWRSGAVRELRGWGIALAVLAVAVAAHAYAVSLVVKPLDPVSPGWTGLMGPGFVVQAIAGATALALLPMVVAAVGVVLALFGWVAWDDAVARRTGSVIAGYALLLMLFARADNFYWVLLIAPLVPIGLLFALDGLRDLIGSARDARRITVTRVVR